MVGEGHFQTQWTAWQRHRGKPDCTWNVWRRANGLESLEERVDVGNFGWHAMWCGVYSMCSEECFSGVCHVSKTSWFERIEMIWKSFERTWKQCILSIFWEYILEIVL